MNPFTITVLSTGLVFWGVAAYVRIHPPKKINALYGYRTKRSMASQEAWDFAQAYSSELMVRAGQMMAIAAVVWLFIPQMSPILEILLGISTTMAVCVFLLVDTEKALKQKFG